MASVALAFGSFGDIVALIQILVDLTVTLRDGRASTEYRELIAEFSSLQSVLENIKAEILTPGLGAPIFDQSSLNAIGLAVQRCHTLVKDFSDSTYGYGKSLMVGEPGNNLWDFWWNVNWRILKKGAIADLREQLTQQKTAMILILTLSSSASLHRMEQQLKQAATAKSTQEQQYEKRNGVPLPTPPPYPSTDKSDTSENIPEIRSFNSLPPSLSLPSPPHTASPIPPSDHQFEGSIFAFPPDETIPKDPFAQDDHKDQLPLSPPDSALLSSPPPPPPKLAKPGWRSVSKPPPRINTNNRGSSPSPSLLNPSLIPRIPSPGLFGPPSPDNADGRISNVGRSGGYGLTHPPPTSPNSLLRPSINGPNLGGAYVHRNGPPYLDATYKQDGWGYPLLPPPAMDYKGGVPAPPVRQPTPGASWASWRPSPALASAPPSVSPILDRTTAWASWLPRPDIVPSPPLSPIPGPMPPQGLFGPRTPDEGWALPLPQASPLL